MKFQRVLIYCLTIVAALSACSDDENATEDADYGSIELKSFSIRDSYGDSFVQHPTNSTGVAMQRNRRGS